MASRILLIGDPHFKANNLDMMAKACREIIEIVAQRKPELCIVLGDTLDSHERIHMTVQAQAISWLRELAKQVPTVVLIGNHDRENNQVFQTPIHPFVGLKGDKDIRIVDAAVWDEQNDFIYVPYVPNGRYLESLETVGYKPLIVDPDDATKYILNRECERHPRFVFSHQEFKGCAMGSRTSTKGDPWSNQLPTTFSGHIHEHQILPGVVYPGTFHQQNYGEEPDKAIMMVTVTGEIDPSSKDSSVTKYMFSMERIRLKSVPLRVTVNLNLADLPDFATKIPSDCQVRAVLHLDATETKHLDSNPHYQSLKNTVDKVTQKVDSNKASIAETMVNQMKDEGRLKEQPDRTIYCIEDILLGMHYDDEYTLEILKNEILI